MNTLQERASRTAGYTMIELVISTVLLSMMIYAVTTLSLTGGQAQEYSRRLNRVTEITQQLTDDVRLELVSSVRLFSNDTEGNGNLALLDLAGAPTPLAGLRLPTVSANESVRADTAGSEITGNSLFFAKLAWTDRFVTTSTNEYLVDVYRWAYYYLAPENGGPSVDNAIGLNIVRVVSEPLIDASSIDRITDATDQEEVLLHLFNATADADGVTHLPAEVVWDRGALASISGTFRHIDSSDGSLSNSPLSPRTSPWEVLRTEPNVTGMLSYRHHSIATVFSRDSFGVSRYGVESTASAGFPHGFEVQIVGPSAARQILIHVVCASTQRSGQSAWSNIQVAVDARDL